MIHSRTPHRHRAAPRSPPRPITAPFSLSLALPPSHGVGVTPTHTAGSRRAALRETNSRDFTRDFTRMGADDARPARAGRERPHDPLRFPIRRSDLLRTHAHAHAHHITSHHITSVAHLSRAPNIPILSSPFSVDLIRPSIFGSFNPMRLPVRGCPSDDMCTLINILKMFM